ncbi:F-box protein At4g09920-like [Aegilops tauschii subsp. strangulata]|uniref:F-box protein At4g09920-like n=1 Tax=Aegilops tauschii subsp. strangulata TaxID=200361 RepID=UPI001ABD3168|nr:F-box/FBD/LRR-repeat protein At1g13570-like [Aegilops tauschii subsp. strangulata]
MEDELANKRGRVEPEPQEPPANMDFISSLPDEMLVTIISHLPIKNGVRATILSRQWCPLWPTTPLDIIVDHEFCSGEQQRLDALSHVLATHLGLVRRLAIGRLNPHNKIEPRLHYWFLSLALDRLEELNLHARHPCSLPPSVLRLAPTLHRATFRRCIFPRIDVTRTLHLPKLKHLELIAIRIWKEDLERLLIGCTTLEYLRLHAMDGFSSLHITSTNVRAIYVHCWRRPWLLVEVFHDIVIENAPFLERLYVLDKLGPARIRVIHAPKLIVLGYSCAEFNELVTGSLSIQKMIPTSLTRPLRIVKILALQSVSPDLDEVVRFLRCFPGTEKLYIKILAGPKVNLTEITFNEYRCTTPEIKFARFFVEKARLLKVMRFALYLVHRSERIAKDAGVYS